MAEVKLNRTVVNTFKILDAISESSTSLGVSQISKNTNLPKTTVFRITETLNRLNIVREDQNQAYKLGEAFLKYINQTKTQNDLVSVTNPFLEEFATETKETINLGILFDDEVVYLNSVEGERFRLQVDLLPVAPLYCSSLGKIFLSTFSDKQFEQYSSKTNFQKNTVNTIVDPTALAKEVKAVKQEQMAFDREEAEYGLTCIACPIKKDGNIIAAISVSGPTSRLKVRGIHQLENKLKSTAANIDKVIADKHISI